MHKHQVFITIFSEVSIAIHYSVLAHECHRVPYLYSAFFCRGKLETHSKCTWACYIHDESHWGRTSLGSPSSVSHDWCNADGLVCLCWTLIVTVGSDCMLCYKGFLVLYYIITLLSTLLSLTCSNRRSICTSNWINIMQYS